MQQCPRCGADLSRLMALAMRAWRLRLDAAEALRAGKCAAAVELADAAQQIVRTPRGAALRALAQWLAASHADSFDALSSDPPLQ